MNEAEEYFKKLAWYSKAVKANNAQVNRITNLMTLGFSYLELTILWCSMDWSCPVALSWPTERAKRLFLSL